MKSLAGSITCLFLLFATAAHGQQQAASAKAASATHSALAATLEAKTRKSWENYQKKNKKDFAEMLAPGFSEVTNEADGIFGKDTELSEMDHFSLAHYDLKDFKVRPLGASGAVVTYTAEYSGTYDNSPVNIKTVYGEVWIKSGNGWKLLWSQETKLKS